jgi:hypothetical protein
VDATTAPLGSGRTADVYALDERRVLRRYRTGGDVRAEAEVMRHLHASAIRCPPCTTPTGRLVLN